MLVYKKFNFISKICIYSLVLVLYSCINRPPVTYQYNGIYRVNENAKGKEFSYIVDTSNIITVDTTTLLSDKDFKRAEMIYESNSNKPIMLITLTSYGKERFEAITENNIGNRLAIIINNQLISVTTVSVAIPSGEIYVVGLNKNQIINFIKQINY